MGGETLTGQRKAFKSLGDDITLSRFIKIPGERKPRKHQPRLPGIGENGFVTDGRTKFTKSVKEPDFVMLKSGHNSTKIGRDVRKKMFKGYWIYYLSLEERKTCPSSCSHWQSCYGNNMPFSTRYDHTAEGFLDKLERQLHLLLRRQPLLVRLHALGDFYSIEYVDFWRRMLYKNRRLALYGYTAREITSDIGLAIQRMNVDYFQRCMIRYSNGGLPIMSTVSIGSVEACPPDAFICPEQTGKTRACATCGLCWTTTKNVAFLEH